MNLGDNFVQEGLANRITPFTTNIEGRPVPGMTTFDVDKTYEAVTKHFKFGGVSKPGIYLDETVMRMCYTHRRLLSQLAMALAQRGDKEKAAEVLALSAKELPHENVPHCYDSGSMSLIDAYVLLGDKAHAKDILEKVWKRSMQYCMYFVSLSDGGFAASQRDLRINLYVLNELARTCEQIDAKQAEDYNRQLSVILNRFAERGGRFN
jgi:ATP/maltotriose-dependent transcriptional regulator MalT